MAMERGLGKTTSSGMGSGAGVMYALRALRGQGGWAAYGGLRESVYVLTLAHTALWLRLITSWRSGSFSEVLYVDFRASWFESRVGKGHRLSRDRRRQGWGATGDQTERSSSAELLVRRVRPVPSGLMR